MSAPLEGLLLVDKPKGPTSHDVVARVRTLVGAARAGHTGTLDPGATGLLLVVLGAATRLARFVPREPKTYTGSVRLGVQTATDDLDGATSFRFEGPAPEAAAVQAAAKSLLGRRLQVPPDVSARKIGGVRMYRLSRMGRPVAGTPTEVVVSRFELEPTGDPFVWDFVTEVSSGTYVRSMARELGELLGCGGAIAELRRTVIGPFVISAAAPLAGSDAPGSALRDAVIPPHQIPFSMPSARLEDEGARKFQSGGFIALVEYAAEDGECAVFGPTGRLLGVGATSAGQLRPIVVLPGPA